jgi:peptide deformylase
MTVLPIRALPDPVLRQKAKKVSTVDKSIKKLIKDMRETLHADAGRAGLAAPQVGVSLRVAVIGLPDTEDIVLVNPEIIKSRGEQLVSEGCLSVPGYVGQLRRAEAVTVKGLDGNGKALRIKAEGFLAQALQHEIDHLNGMLYVDRMDDPEALRKITETDEAAI